MAQTDRYFIKRQLIEADRLSAVQPEGSFMARAWAERRENLEKALKENCDSTGTGEEEAAGNHQESNRLDEPRTIITEIKNRLVPCGQYPRSRSHRAAQTGQLPQRLPPRRCVSGEAWIEAMQER